MEKLSLLYRGLFCLSLSNIPEICIASSEGPYPFFKMPLVPVVAQKPFGFLKKSPDVRVIKKKEEFPDTHRLANIFEGVSNLNPTSSGGEGSLSLVYFPGSLSSGTLVLWEDLTLNDPSTPTGTFDFSAFGAEVFDSIEIFQGNDPKWGTSGTGGTIRLSTSFLEKSPHDSKVKIESGSNGEAFLEGRQRIFFKKGILKVGGTGFRTDGAPVGRKPISRRRQAYDTASFDAQGRFQMSERMKISFFLKETDSELQDLYSLQGKFLTQSHLGAFTLSTQNFSGDTKQRLGLSNNVSVRRSLDGFSVMQKNKGNREEIRYAIAHSIAPHVVVEGGGGMVKEDFYRSGFKKKREFEYLFLSQTSQVMPNVNFTSGGRIEGNVSRNNPLFAFKTGLSYDHETVSRGVTFDIAQKRPSLYELYASDAFVQGDSRLKTEQAYGLQAFMLKKNAFIKTDLGLRLFERWFSRPIIGVIRNGKIFYETAPFYRTQGVEPFWTLKLTEKIKFQGAFTYTDLKKGSASSDLKILTPPFKAVGTLFYELMPPKKGEQEASVLYLKGRYLNYKNNQIAGPSSFSIFDMGWDYYLNTHQKIYGGVKNILNTQYRTQTDANIKGEPLSFYVGMAFKF